MGTYNGARFIREQLDSLAAQSRLPLELVVCDDLSTDGTMDLVREFAAKAPFPVRLEVNKARLGFAGNFLRASGLCRGELIAFCDQDDVWYSEKLAICVGAFSNPEVVLCAHDADLCDADGRITGRHVSGVSEGCYPALTLNPWGIFFGFTCVFRRDLLHSIDPSFRPLDARNPALQMSHDSWIYFLAHCFGETSYVGRPLAKYRQHGSNLYGSNDLSALQKIRKLVREYEAYLVKYRNLAHGRVQALEAGTTSQDFAKGAARAHRFWSNLESLYARRLQASMPRSLMGRTRHVAEMWRMGTYASVTNGGLGRRALAEDVVAALSYPLRQRDRHA